MQILKEQTSAGLDLQLHWIVTTKTDSRCWDELICYGSVVGGHLYQLFEVFSRIYILSCFSWCKQLNFVNVRKHLTHLISPARPSWLFCALRFCCFFLVQLPFNKKGRPAVQTSNPQLCLTLKSSSRYAELKAFWLEDYFSLR